VKVGNREWEKIIVIDKKFIKIDFKALLNDGMKFIEIMP